MTATPAVTLYWPVCPMGRLRLCHVTGIMQRVDTPSDNTISLCMCSLRSYNSLQPHAAPGCGLHSRENHLSNLEQICNAAPLIFVPTEVWHAFAQDLTYTVNNSAKRGDKLALLRDVSGFFLPGHMSALVRVSRVVDSGWGEHWGSGHVVIGMRGNVPA